MAGEERDDRNGFIHFPHTHLHKAQGLTGVHSGGMTGYTALVPSVKGLEQENKYIFTLEVKTELD